MKPFYWQGTTNFGDFLNHRIWPEILEGYLSPDDNTRLIGIGSLLKSSINHLEGKKVIFGTGSGYGLIPPASATFDWKFYFVRGPRTAECFRLPKEKGIVDGAWLIGLLPHYHEHARFDKKGTTFIPHWTSADSGNWDPICQQAGMTYLNPLDDLEKILDMIARSALIITESLHGAIIADLFRTPWIPVNISPKFLAFKWIDWYESVGLDPSMTDLPFSDFFEYLYNNKRPKNIKYNCQPYSINASPPKTEEIEPTAFKPGFIYRQKISLKRNLRNTRRNFLNGMLGVRNIYPISKWNLHHQCKIAETLISIAKQEPLLSSDQTKQSKLQQLSDAVTKLKKDYDSGKI